MDSNNCGFVPRVLPDLHGLKDFRCFIKPIREKWCKVGQALGGGKWDGNTAKKSSVGTDISTLWSHQLLWSCDIDVIKAAENIFVHVPVSTSVFSVQLLCLTVTCYK